MFTPRYGATKHFLTSFTKRSRTPNHRRRYGFLASRLRSSVLRRIVLPTAGVLLSSYALIFSVPFSRLDGPPPEISKKSIQALSDNRSRVESTLNQLIERYFEVAKPERTEEQKKLVGYIALLWITNFPQRGRAKHETQGNTIRWRAALGLAQRYTKSEDFDDYESMMEEFAKTEETIYDNTRLDKAKQASIVTTEDEKWFELRTLLGSIIVFHSGPEAVTKAFRRCDQENPPPMKPFEKRDPCGFLRFYLHAERIMLCEGFLEGSDIGTREGQKWTASGTYFVEHTLVRYWLEVTETMVKEDALTIIDKE